MDLHQSSKNRKDDVESELFETFDDKIYDNCAANIENFLVQERKYSLLSTISEQDSEAEEKLNALEPEKPMDQGFEPIPATGESKENVELPTTPAEKCADPINVKSKHDNMDETLETVADTVAERKEVSPQRDFQITEQVAYKVQGVDVVLSKDEVEEITQIEDEMNRQLANAAVEVKSERRSPVWAIVKEFEDKFIGSDKSEFEKPKLCAKEGNENANNDQQSEEIPKAPLSTEDVNNESMNDLQKEEAAETNETSQLGTEKDETNNHDLQKEEAAETNETSQLGTEKDEKNNHDLQKEETAETNETSQLGTEEDETNNHEKIRAKRPNPIVIPEIFIHRPEGQTVEYLSHRGTEIPKGIEANEQNAIPSSTPEVGKSCSELRKHSVESELKILDSASGAGNDHQGQSNYKMANREQTSHTAPSKNSIDSEN